MLGGSKLTYCSLAVYHRQYRKTIAYRWLDVIPYNDMWELDNPQYLNAALFKKTKAQTLGLSNTVNLIDAT